MPVLELLQNRRFWVYAAALGILALLFWPGEPPLNRGGLQSGWGKPGLSPEILDQATIVCSGHFSQTWQPYPSISTAEIAWTIRPGDDRAVKGLRKIVSFNVDHYWRGNGPSTLQVAMVQPTEFAYGPTWFFPGKEKLLLALKPDNSGSGALQLVNQPHSWLVLRNETTTDPAPATPQDEVIHAARDYLAGYATGTEEKDPITLMEPVRLGSLIPGQQTTDSNFVIGQTLATLGQFRVHDARIIALLKSYLTPTLSPPTYEEVIQALIQIDPIGGWNYVYDLYQSPTLTQQDSYLISFELPPGITKDTISQLDPARIQKLIRAGPHIRRDVAHALQQIESPALIPYYEQFLSDPDEMVQYSGMWGIYNLAGRHKSGIRFPATSIFKSDEEQYLAPFRQWCEQHKPPAAATPPTP